MKLIYITISLLLTCFVLISCDAEENKPKDKKPQGGRKDIPLVRELTNEFTAYYHEMLPTLIMFYTPWCSYSEQLQPVLYELSEILAGSIMVARIDVSLYSDIARFFQIKETPTIAYINNGKTLVCEQELILENLVQFALAAAGPDVYRVNSTVDLGYWIGNYSVIFLLAYDREIVDEWHSVYVSVAAQKKTNLRFLYTNDSEVVQEKFSVKQFPALLAIKDGQAHFYDEPVTYHAMSIWIDNERLPLLVHMNISTARRYTKLPAGKKMLLSLLDRKSHEKVYSVIKRLAEGRRFHSGYQFAWTEDDSLITAITGSSSVVKPFLLVWDTEKRQFYPLQDDNELTAKLITTFLLDVSKQKVEPQVAATSYLDLLENLVTMIYAICWVMYIQRPLLSLVTVIMLLLGTYLFLCGPKKKEDKKSRPLRRTQPRRRKEYVDEAEVENIPADTAENEPRRRNVNRTNNDNDTIDIAEDTHAN